MISPSDRLKTDPLEEDNFYLRIPQHCCTIHYYKNLITKAVWEADDMLRRLTGCLTPSLLAVRCQSSLQSGCYGHADGVVRLHIPSNQSVLDYSSTNWGQRRRLGITPVRIVILSCCRSNQIFLKCKWRPSLIQWLFSCHALPIPAFSSSTAVGLQLYGEHWLYTG